MQVAILVMATGEPLNKNLSPLGGERRSRPSKRGRRHFPPSGFYRQVLRAENREAMYIHVHHEIRRPGRAQGERIGGFCHRSRRNLYEDQSPHCAFSRHVMGMATRFKSRSVRPSQVGEGMKDPIPKPADRMVPFIELPIPSCIRDQSLHHVIRGLRSQHFAGGPWMMLPSLPEVMRPVMSTWRNS